MPPGGADSHVAEAAAQVVFRQAGTLSQLGVRCGSSSGGSAIKARIAGSDGTLSVGTSSNSLAIDSANADLVTAGQAVCFENRGANISLIGISAVFEAAGNHCCYYSNNDTTGKSLSTASTTFYFSLSGSTTAGADGGTTESVTSFTSRATGTWRNFQVYVGSNGRSTSTVVKSRKNTADGNCSITIGAGLTGLFEDTSNTDTLADGDSFNWSAALGTGTGAIVFNRFSSAITNATVAKNDVFVRHGAARAASASANFPLFGGKSGGTTTEADSKMRHGFAVTTSRLRLSVSANTYTGSATFRNRNNGADATQVLTIGAGLTGIFEDTTHTDDYGATDDANYSIAGGTSGSLTWQWAAITEQDISGGFVPRVIWFC
jgi:hypothetical protein